MIISDALRLPFYNRVKRAFAGHAPAVSAQSDPLRDNQTEMKIYNTNISVLKSIECH